MTEHDNTELTDFIVDVALIAVTNSDGNASDLIKKHAQAKLRELRKSSVKKPKLEQNVRLFIASRNRVAFAIEAHNQIVFVKKDLPHVNRLVMGYTDSLNPHFK